MAIVLALDNLIPRSKELIQEAPSFHDLSVSTVR